MILGRFPVRAVWAAMLLVGAVLAFAPSSAQAHAGHSHSRQVATTQPAPAAQPVEIAKSKSAAARSDRVFSENLTAAPLSASPGTDVPDCPGQGCCHSGPCTGCHGFVLAAETFMTPSLFSTLIVASEPPPPGSADSDRLRRPPRSFA